MDDVSDALPLREPTFFILTALAGGPAHGYGILQNVDEMSDGRVRPGRARSTALWRARGRGLRRARPRGERGRTSRRYFKLTTAGRRLLQAEAERQATNAELVRARLRPATS